MNASQATIVQVLLSTLQGLYTPDTIGMAAESDVKYLLLRKEAEEDLL